MMGFFSALLGKQNNDALMTAIRGGAFLVDVRTAAEFSAGTVKGAINIPLDTLTKQITLCKNKKTIVVFCRSGNRSSLAKKILEQNGIPGVVDGGSFQNVNRIINQHNE